MARRNPQQKTSVKSNEKTETKMTDTPIEKTENATSEKIEETTDCTCADLKEIGFHRCQDDMIYITYLCQGCQKIKIRKFKLEFVSEMKFI